MCVPDNLSSVDVYSEIQLRACIARHRCQQLLRRTTLSTTTRSPRVVFFVYFSAFVYILFSCTVTHEIVPHHVNFHTSYSVFDSPSRGRHKQRLLAESLVTCRVSSHPTAAGSLGLTISIYPRLLIAVGSIGVQSVIAGMYFYDISFVEFAIILMLKFIFVIFKLFFL